MHLAILALVGSTCLAHASGDQPFSEPIVAKAETNYQRLLLHFNVQGKDRLFLIDSGSWYSAYEPKVWPKQRRGGPYQMDICSSTGKHLAMVYPEPHPDLGLYDTAPRKCDALLGLDFLKQFVILYDSHRGVALLWPSASTDARAVLAHSQNENRGWAGESFIDAWSQPWLVLPTDTDEHHRLLTTMSIDSHPLRGLIDTGCFETNVCEPKLRTIEHWQYGAWDTDQWELKVAQTISLVLDLKLPFTSSAIASVADIDDDPTVDGCVGLDLLSRGRWIMDDAHRLFAFQPRVSKPATMIHMLGPDLFVKPDGSIWAALSDTDASLCAVSMINGNPVKPLLGDFVAPGPSKEYARGLAARLAKIVSKPYEITVTSGSQSWPEKITPWPRGKAPTYAELESSGPPSLAGPKVTPASYTSRDGKLKTLDQANGPVLLPAGTSYQAGGWSVNKTNLGSIILAPPGYEPVNGVEGAVVVLRGKNRSQAILPLPAPGGELIVPKATMYVGPPEWKCGHIKGVSGLIVRRPAGSLSNGEPDTPFVLDPRSDQPSALEDAATVLKLRCQCQAKCIVTLPQAWSIQDEKSGMLRLMKGDSGATTVWRTPDESQLSKKFTNSGITQRPATSSAPEDTVVVVPPGWTAQLGKKLRLVLISPDGLVIVIAG